jgi:hypothetical protein
MTVYDLIDKLGTLADCGHGGTTVYVGVNHSQYPKEEELESIEVCHIENGSAIVLN